MTLKQRVDAFRRTCEALIVSGAYTPSCTPSEWWSLWATIERELGIEGV